MAERDVARSAMAADIRPGGGPTRKHGLTVAAACELYVADRRAEKGEGCAHDAHMRFRRTVYGTPFGECRLHELCTPLIRAWRDALPLGQSSRNRTLTTLRAALNLAVRNRLAPGELLLLCSDGLSGELEDRQIQAQCARAGSLDELVTRLLEQACDAGGRDNISCIVIKLASPETSAVANRSKSFLSRLLQPRRT